MKKLINHPEDVTREQLLGLKSAHEDVLEVSFDPTYVKRRYTFIDKGSPGSEGPGGAVSCSGSDKVAIVSGGGSGHEPMHVGYVGYGMLDAACPGQVFTSPSPDQIVEACRSVAGPKGVLNIVKNYTGDVMNFQMAADLLMDEGIQVRNVIIDDDVAVKDSTYTAGRRGLGTTVIAEKICGAAAEMGYDLEELADLCLLINRNGKSMGMALTPCITPQNGTPSFTLGEDEMEIGIGIHGEPGIERMRMKSADEITELLTTSILEDGAYTRELSQWSPEKRDWVDVEVVDNRFEKGDRAIVIVNSMGGTPLGELYAVYHTMREIAEKKGVTIVRKMIGYYITSMEMQGVSITLVKADDRMIELFDAPVNTPGLRWGM